MNIFVLDLDLSKCASYHIDKHCGKMIVEAAQMLSTACRLSGLDYGYKITHVNHPCNKWVRESLSNWYWLKELTKHLNREWQQRYNHLVNHKSYSVILTLPKPKITDIGLTSFAQAMPDEYKNSNPVVAYRNYYRYEKRDIATWKNSIPGWWNV
jgi:hypothetical protein